MTDNPCASCTMRQKIRAGCCVQGNHPPEMGSKSIVQKKDGQVIRKIEACGSLDAATGECLSYYEKPEMCGFKCERFI